MEAASLAHTSWIAPFLCLTPFFLRMVRISAASRPPAWVTTSPSLTKPALSITAQTTSFPPQVISGLLKRGCALAWRTLSTLASSRGLNPAHAVMISSARESVTPALTEERLRQSAQRPKGGPRCRSCMRKCFHMKLLLSGVMIFLTSLTLGACFLQSKLTSLRPPLSSGWIMTSWATWFIFDPHRKLPMTSLMFFSRCGDRGQTASTWFTKESTSEFMTVTFPFIPILLCFHMFITFCIFPCTPSQFFSFAFSSFFPIHTPSILTISPVSWNPHVFTVLCSAPHLMICVFFVFILAPDASQYDFTFPTTL
ncbi:uncharacterized protein LOC114449601 isoform X1 [Parambassis ranga]|uniref:Uncharacterized protein LOC114449601 isoform X1 n=1 Tax=Parambassis ranga TaxID=210632 RepID=A0A6P7K6I9_9TELE|nr:uncharacterized protein LOC114449601 isoform X1 [Parambassis ranga]